MDVYPEAIWGKSKNPLFFARIHLFSKQGSNDTMYNDNDDTKNINVYDYKIWIGDILSPSPSLSSLLLVKMLIQIQRTRRRRRRKMVKVRVRQKEGTN